MKSNWRTTGVISASMLLGGLIATSAADVRVIWRPFRVRPVVVAPFPLVVRPGPVVVAPGPGVRATGSIDVSVRPGRAKVFVDGQYVGVADDFDGNPGYLVTSVGEHRVMFSLEGFKPLEFVVQVEPERVVTLDVDMPPADAAEGVATAQQTPAAPGAGTSPAAPVAAESVYKLDTVNTGSLAFEGGPKDAAVYINGTYYGTIADFSRNGSAIVLQKGGYRIEIVRPGFKNFGKTITLQQGENQVIGATLEKTE